MRQFRFRNVVLESYGLHFPEEEVSSAAIEDRLAPLYEKLKVPFGTLEKLSGIKTRRLWPVDTPPSVGALAVTKKVLDDIGFDQSKIGAIVNCSVTRDFFEPGTSCIVHEQLGFGEDILAFDITNACIGFSNGIQILGNLIDTGVIEAGVVVSCENIACIVENTMQRLLNDTEMDRDQFLAWMPTFTLGCGAAAAVLCHKDIATRNHRIHGSVARCATQHSDLCVGNGDFFIRQITGMHPVMQTQSHKLVSEAAKLGARTWNDFSETFGWSREDIDHIFCHQVGRHVNERFYETMTLDYEKEFSVYQRYGNLVSAALPSALFTGIEEKGIQAGEKILCTGFGSGLNSIFMGIEW